MRYPPSETAEKHKKILAEAASLFRERGFDGVNVSEIMKAAGLTHGAFYAHFKSKEALAAEAVTCAMGDALDRMYKEIDGADDPNAAFLADYLSLDHRDDPGDGCTMAALGAEVARTPGLRGAFTTEVKRILAGMVDRLRWKTKKPARQNAQHLLSAIVGAMVLARAVDDPDLSKEILDNVRESLAAL